MQLCDKILLVVFLLLSCPGDLTVAPEFAEVH
jgi:hypothetical protein